MTEVIGGERPTPPSTATAGAASNKSIPNAVEAGNQRNWLGVCAVGRRHHVWRPVSRGAARRNCGFVGFNITLNEYEYISSIQPLYQTTKGQVAGTAYGYVNGPPTSIIAKKGYAISSVQVQGSSYMYGLQVEFMKLEKNGLDAKDTYSSNWVGRKYSGYRQIMLGNDGQPVVGVYGKTSTWPR